MQDMGRARALGICGGTRPARGCCFEIGLRENTERAWLEAKMEHAACCAGDSHMDKSMAGWGEYGKSYRGQHQKLFVG